MVERLLTVVLATCSILDFINTAILIFFTKLHHCPWNQWDFFQIKNSTPCWNMHILIFYFSSGHAHNVDDGNVNFWHFSHFILRRDNFFVWMYIKSRIIHIHYHKRNRLCQSSPRFMMQIASNHPYISKFSQQQGQEQILHLCCLLR